MSDPIERQSVFDILNNVRKDINGWVMEYIDDGVLSIPSTEPEVILCKDCKWYEWDHMNDAYCCMECGYNFPEEDDFCSDAERREDVRDL